MVNILDKDNVAISYYYEIDKESLNNYKEELLNECDYNKVYLNDVAFPELNVSSKDQNILNFEYEYTFRKKYLNVDGKISSYPTFNVTYDEVTTSPEYEAVCSLCNGEYEKFNDILDAYPHLNKFFNYLIITTYNRFSEDISSKVIINNHKTKNKTKTK